MPFPLEYNIIRVCVYISRDTFALARLFRDRVITYGLRVRKARYSQCSLPFFKLDSTTLESFVILATRMSCTFSDRLKRSYCVVHDNNKPQCGLHWLFVFVDKAIKATNKFFSAAYCKYHFIPSVVESSHAVN